MARIIYLEHSGFAVDLNDDVILVFDYFRDPSHALHRLLEANPQKKVIFFISHRHLDHYNHEIFEVAQNHERTYVVSNDIPAKDIPSTVAVAGMSAGDIVGPLAGGIMVKAYKSTDAGICFMVTLADGKRIFHAGDLNDWHWQDESKPREAQKAEEAFKVIVNHIASEVPAVDVAMFPVDARLGTDYFRGAQIFLETIKTANFFPMHFGADWQEACAFEAYKGSSDTHFYCLHTPGKSVDIEL